MALLSAKKKATAKKAAPPPPSKRYRVVLAQYKSEHASKTDASRAMAQLKLKGDDIAFILEEKI